MRRLFDKNDNITDQGRTLQAHVSSVLSSTVKSYCDDDFSIRDIEVVIVHAVTDICLDCKIRNSVEKLKAKTQQLVKKENE